MVLRDAASSRLRQRRREPRPGQPDSRRSGRQLADHAGGARAALQQLAREELSPPGSPRRVWDGEIDYAAALAIMGAAGYSGWVSIESYFGDRSRSANAEPRLFEADSPRRPPDATAKKGRPREPDRFLSQPGCDGGSALHHPRGIARRAGGSCRPKGLILPAALAECDFILVPDQPVRAEQLAAAPKLKMIQHQGVGYERIDLQPAAQQNSTCASRQKAPRLASPSTRSC